MNRDARRRVTAAVPASISVWLAFLALVVVIVLVENRRVAQQRVIDAQRNVSEVEEARYQGQILGQVYALRDRVDRNERNVETLGVHHGLDMGAGRPEGIEDD